MGTVDRRGYGGQQKGTICDARGPYHAHWSQFFAELDWFVVITSRLDAYISRYGDFCANDNNDNDNDDTTDYFTPCACARGKNASESTQQNWHTAEKVSPGDNILCGKVDYHYAITCACA